MTRAADELSRPDKVLFADPGVTKAELAEYFEIVAPVMVGHLRQRPLVVRRYPDGVDGAGFVQQQAPRNTPDDVETVSVAADNRRGAVRHLVVDEAGTLRFLANQACLELHRWLSRADRIDNPDLLVLDLDPSEHVTLAVLRRTARAAAELFDTLGLTPYLMATGSSGYHVVAPLDREATFQQARELARAIAEKMAEDSPDELTTEQRMAKRGDRLFLDTGRNAYGQTAVAPYSPRARAGAPVATPLEWDELSKVEPDHYDLLAVRRRLAQKPDPWSDIADHAGSVASALRRLSS
ncbi:non-homologous end-joining DNA ligase [Pseudonocardia spinosispora]|uniref:non-homologous end-joining DNA ligase n=1 Tax=Pseudonocardia spinosispora TaxID=103441 RepID=UPI00041546B4|nr:non-homologous end-joining DNA ligase [Pseudonocardia spinosispora]